DRGAGQIRVSHSEQHLLHGWDPSQIGTFHGPTLIVGLLERTIWPITAAQGVWRPASKFKTVCSPVGGTASSRPPLVCASVRSVIWAGFAPSHFVNRFAYMRLSRLPPG